MEWNCHVFFERRTVCQVIVLCLIVGASLTYWAFPKHVLFPESVAGSKNADAVEVTQVANPTGKDSSPKSLLSPEKVGSSNIGPSPVQVTNGTRANLKASSPKQYYVTCYFGGRLGNQMFDYASLLGIARMNNRTAWFPTASILRYFFHVTKLADRDRRNYVKIPVPQVGTYDVNMEHLPPRDAYINNHIHAWRYFWHMKDEIRRELTLLPPMKKAGMDLLQKVTPAGREKAKKIGIHVRLEDVVGNPNGRKMAPVSYLQKATDWMRKKYVDVVFIAACQDDKWCREHLKHMSDVVVSPPVSAGTHMAMLILCDHVVMTVGTYGWMGAWLAGGDVIYYANYSVPNSHFHKQYSVPADHFLPTWIPLGD